MGYRYFFPVLYLVCFILSCSFIPVHAERMVTDMSRHEIEITSRFSGAELLIFGAIEQHIPQDDGGHGVMVQGMDYDVIVVVQSEKRDMIIRRKARVGPIWANRDTYRLEKAPGFYTLISTRPLKQMLSERQLAEMALGTSQMALAFAGDFVPAEKTALRAGFIRNMKAQNLYSEQEGMVSILDGILFRAILKFPANMPVGNYTVDVYLVRGGDVLLHQTAPLEVGKRGLELVIHKFAHEYPAYYGIIAVLVALLAGWLGGFLSRRWTRG